MTAAVPILLAAVQLSGGAYTVDEPLERPADARLAWADEFDGTALDTSKWSFDTARNKVGWFNGERQYYAADRPENVRVEGGKLILEARRDPEAIKARPDWGGQAYSSGKITTRGKGSWTYGFYEVKAKLPCARGTWPAIWLMPETPGPWPDQGEIDVMEMVGSRPGWILASLHTRLYNHKINTQRSGEQALPTACSEFHRYQLEWRPDQITIGVDDHAYMRVKNDKPGGRGAWPFDKPFYLILNLAIGGPWAGAKGIDDKAMPQRMEVDYVRVWSLPAR